MKTLIKDGLQMILVVLLTSSVAYAAQPQAPSTQESSQVQSAQTTEIASEPISEPAEPVIEPKTVTWQDNPQKCNQDTQYIAQEAPFNCIDKPVAVTSNVQASGAQSISAGTGDCAAEIAKYDWNYNVALAVATAESGLNPGIVNDNPATRDYSVGCFQVNIYGRNAANRPGEAALKNAQINVQWSYNNYVANGRSFIGQWGVCNSKVACY